MAADVNSNLNSWSTSEGSNSPGGTTAISTNLDDNLRQIQATTRKYLAHKGSDIASGATVDLSTADGLIVDITGTTTATGFGTLSAGMWKILQFDDAMVIKYNATSMLLPGDADLTTDAGACALVYTTGSGNWVMPFYTPGVGYVTLTGTQTLTNKTLTAPTINNSTIATATITGGTLTSPVLNTGVSGTAIASQAQQETGTATDVIVTPGRQIYNPAHPKAWVMFTQSGTTVTIRASHGVTSVVRNTTGDYTVTWSTAFSSQYYGVLVTGDADRCSPNNYVQTTTTFQFVMLRSDNSSQEIDTSCTVMAFGDQ